MAYNRKHLLKKIIDIQDITIEHTSKGVTQEWVYRHKIYPVYRISRRTYTEYLGTNAKKELKEIEQKKDDQDKRQYKLF